MKDVPNSGTYVMMLSGGLDSALLSYLVLKELPNTKLVLSSVCHESLNYYNLFNVIAITNWLHARFPNRIEEHYIGYYKDRNEARNNRTKTRDRLIDKHKASGILTGMTLNPSELLIEGRDESRDKKREIRVISSHGVYHYRPFINSTKQTVAELYNEHNLQDLADLTISCESESLPRPCKECWWCKEKYWAFGYY